MNAALLVLALAACSTGASAPELPRQSTGTLGRYELAAGVHTTVRAAAAYRFGHASIDDARRVARAFGIRAEPKADAHGWSFGPYGRAVEGVQPPSAYVARNGRFKLVNDRAVAHTDVRPSSTGLMTPTTVLPKNFTLADAEDVAVRALRAAGVTLRDAAVTVPYSDGYFVTVDVAPRVDHVLADGYVSQVSIDQDKTITGADGIVTTPASVGRYELESPKRAVARLNDGFAVNTCIPRALRGLPGFISCGLQPSGRPDAVTTLTRVKGGLMMSYDDTSAWLIPAYLFTTSGGATVVTPAAADQYFGTKTH